MKRNSSLLRIRQGTAASIVVNKFRGVDFPGIFSKKLFREIEYLAIYKNIGYRPVDIIIIIKKSTYEFSAICIGLL